jgi:hypothetical protein
MMYYSMPRIGDQSMVRLFAVLILAGTLSSADAQPVDLSAHPTIELSDLVVELLPADGFRSMGWDYMVNDPLMSWKTNGTARQGSWTTREGLVHVTVGGKASQILRQKWENLPWTVTLSTSDNEKFGPKRIEIKPGGNDTDNICFGDRFRGCKFTEAQALSAKGLKATPVCHLDMVNSTLHGYSVSAPGKKPSLLIYELNEGSGGESSSIEIRPLSDKADACNPTN